jgi:DMSO/TMAO reductase YedYZ molybdopterin-dependent catalytic subunit
MRIGFPLRLSLAATLVLTLILGAFGSSAAQDASPSPTADSIEIFGDVAHPGTWSVAELKKLPTETVELKYLSDTGEQQHQHFTGVRLWDVVQLAESPDDPAGQAVSALTSYLVLRAKDGYFVVFSMGEIAPDYGDGPYVLAWKTDGHPLPDEQKPLMLVAPGDRTDGRFIYGIVSIEVRGVSAA